MLRRTLLAVGLAFAAPALAESPGLESQGLELLFVDKAGCPWCARFEQEVLPGYPHSDIGKAAPFRRASLDNGQPRNVALDEPVRFTPTFILLRDGKEAGRIVGYMDNGTFYGLMDRLLAEKSRKAEAVR